MTPTPADVPLEQWCQRVMDARGYLVIGSAIERRPGDVISGAQGIDGTGYLDHPLVALCSTDIDDARVQWKMFDARFDGLTDSPWPYFYRVIAE